MSTAKRTSQVIQATDEILSPRISYNGTNIISPQTADMTGEWKLNGRNILTDIATITLSGSGINKIIGANSTNTANEYKTLVAGSNVSIIHSLGSITISADVSGGSGASSTELAAISANLQSQINNISASGVSLLTGIVNCNTTDKNYSVSYITPVSPTSYPLVSLVVPNSGSAISVVGVYNTTITGYSVILSSIPETTGYKLSWAVATSGSLGGTGGGGGGTGTVNKYATNIGNGILTDIPVTHNLNTIDVISQVYRNSNNKLVDCEIKLTSENITTFTFAVAPSSNEFRAIIMG